MKQLKDEIIERIAEKLQIPKGTVETVVMEQFRSISSRMSTDTSIEMTGFGVFHFLPKKAGRMLEALKEAEQLQKPLNPEQTMEGIRRDITLIQNQIDKCLELKK